MKKIFLLFVLVATLFLKAPVANAAVTEIPWGGEFLSSITCTCSGNTLNYIFDFKTMSMLMLVYQPGASRFYSNYNPYGRYQLGTYMPGVGTCEIYVGNSCTQVTSTGQYGTMPGTGTSI